MADIILCADTKCPQNRVCSRYIADPAIALEKTHKIRVEPTFRAVLTYECSKFTMLQEIPVYETYN